MGGCGLAGCERDHDPNVHCLVPVVDELQAHVAELEAALSTLNIALSAERGCVAELEAKCEQERKARHAAEKVNAEAVLAKRTNLLARIEVAEARVAELEAALWAIADALDRVGYAARMPVDREASR